MQAAYFFFLNGRTNYNAISECIYTFKYNFITTLEYPEKDTEAQVLHRKIVFHVICVLKLESTEHRYLS